MFTNSLLLYDSGSKKPLVDLSYWAQNTYPSTYRDMTSIEENDAEYLKSVKGTNMRYMFSGCRSLTSLDVSDWDTSKVTNMESMISYCSSLFSLDVSNFDTSNVTTMFSMFSGCYSLTSLDLSDWNTSNVTNMSCMFENCGPLSSLDVSDWDTSNVTNMGLMFNNCISLTSLDLSNWDTSSVTNMSCMFMYCSALTSLDLSNWDTSNVTNMSYMFDSCNLEYMTLNSNTVKMTISNNLNNTCKILVPSSALETYKAHSAWSSRASQFDAIENYIITREKGQVTVTPAIDVGQSPLRINIPMLTRNLQLDEGIEYPVEVTNTSDYELSNIEIENESSGEVLRSSSLSSKKSFRGTDYIYVSESEILDGGIDTVYNVTADSEDPNNSSISFTSTPYTYITDPINSSLEITFDEDNTYYYEGNTITAYLNVVNDGNVTLTNIHINVAATGDSYTLSSLEPGETFYRSLSYTATSGDATNGEVYISASITADSPDTNNPTVTFSGGYSYRVVRRYRLTVYYVDTDGNTVANTFTNTYVSGDEYNVTSPTFVGMRADYDRVRGTITDSDVTVTVTYTAITYGLSIRYVYLNGTTAAPDYYGEFAHDSNYSVTSPAIQGYTPDHAVVSGTMPARDVIMTVIYTANPNS